ncbi:DNA cytosine methyltransferase [Amycolatopsis sp. YIM 10]|uniref:DNA cytosine methyltransferase n=1 Tax=Amycolatopsis sp. YIM 10 TaxID=2653857 RepID=UPI0012903F77|nr:DNA cytosine methyltransferase [Amycolatopsis sp. YIM 10]QFU86765.1 putative BsuMI modification methylase subunit YdiP [Amycolatopsis sp. YIM 10]
MNAADPAIPAPGAGTHDDLRFVATEGPVIGSLCTGAGGLDLGVAAVLGGRIAWYSEVDPHAARVLAARLPGVPNLGDLRAVDFATVAPVEVLTAGFPCQDISAAGRRAGIEKGARSGLWTNILDAIRVLRPRIVVVENVAALRWRGGGLDRVLGGLAEAGYDAVWRCVRAADIGAAHRRERVFLCAIPTPGWDADDAHPAGP